MRFIYRFFLLCLFVLECTCGLISCSSSDNTHFPYPDNKIWAHRVNSIDSINVKLNSFDGIECDLIFSEFQNKLFIAHDWEDTVSCITLETWLRTIVNPNTCSIWFDIKNLTSSNASSIIRILNHSLKPYSLKNHVFIESSSYKALKKIKKKGFYVILWADSPDNASDEIQWKKNMQYKIDYLNPHAISGIFTMFPLLTQSFPDENIHLWHTPANYTPENILLTKQYCQHPSVKIVLTDYPQQIDY